jgi:hypothetical protein
LRSFDRWNQKVHIYAGLALLGWLWLFAVSGLLLNHMRWAEFWPQRQQERFEQRVELLAAGAPLERARGLSRQLGAEGEITLPAKQPGGHFAFRVARPGRMVNVDIDEASGAAAVERITVNGWGVLNALHSFTGVRGGGTRNWPLTWLWSVAMDVTCVGMILFGLGGIWMWWRSGRRRVAGLLALGAGVGVCFWLVFGFR